MFRQDYIKRLIEEFASFLARMAALVGSGKLEQAETELQTAEDALGLPHGSDRLDARSLALLLGGKDKVVLLCLILEQRAILHEAHGKPEDTARCRHRARQLLACAEPEELSREAAELRDRLG